MIDWLSTGQMASFVSSTSTSFLPAETIVSSIYRGKTIEARLIPQVKTGSSWTSSPVGKSKI